jgi:hypothetical protein
MGFALPPPAATVAWARGAIARAMARPEPFSMTVSLSPIAVLVLCDTCPSRACALRVAGS